MKDFCLDPMELEMKVAVFVVAASENRIVRRNWLCSRRRMGAWRLGSVTAWKSGNLGLSVVILPQPLFL